MELKKVFAAGDILIMKKPHACARGEQRMEVLRCGSDIRVRCLGCGREMMIPRLKLERNIRGVEPKEK